MTFPVIICSKQRSKNCTTIQMLKGTDIDWIVFLEKEDVKDYIDQGIPEDRVSVLPLSSMGIGYARKTAIDVVREAGVSDWVWMLDDDIKQFYYVENKKCIKCDLKAALEGAENIFLKEKNVALASLEYQQFAWSAKKEFTLNGYADVVVCVNLHLTKKICHRSVVNLKEDRDFAMQVIASGFNTLKVSKFAFSCPPLGSNSGGLCEVYSKREKIFESCMKMKSLWGEEVISIIEKKNGMPDVKINWKKIKVLK